MLATNLHFRVQMISRRVGSRATASAAYRSGSKVTQQISTLAKASYRSGDRLVDHQMGATFDYTTKEGVSYTTILAPDNAPAWMTQRQSLWNGVEAAETRKDAQLARDIVAALPRGLCLEKQIDLVEEFVEQAFVSQGMVADIAIHNKQASDGQDNPHVHIMLTTRHIMPEGFGKKNREWNQRKLIDAWREAYQHLCNRYLEEADSTQRVSLASYEARGVNRIPTEHLGHVAWNLEQRGIETMVGNRNRATQHQNFLKSLFEPETIPAEPLERNIREVARSLIATADDAYADIPTLKPVHFGLTDHRDDITRTNMQQHEREVRLLTRLTMPKRLPHRCCHWQVTRRNHDPFNLCADHSISPMSPHYQRYDHEPQCH